MMRFSTALLNGMAMSCLLAFSCAAQSRMVRDAKVPLHTLPAQRTEIVGYFPQWGIYNRRYIPVDLIHSGAVRSLTQLNYAQANISNNACIVADPKADTDIPFKAEDSINGVADEPDAPLHGNFHQLQLLKARYPKLRILISIEGKAELFAEAAKPENRVAFVHSCIARFLEGHLAPGMEVPHLFDGIDVDWEYPDADHADDFYALMAEFRRQMDDIRWKSTALRAGTSQRGFTLSIASGAGQKHITPIDWARVAPNVDQIGVMAYDYSGPWARDTGFHAPLSSANPKAETVSTTINAYLAAGAPAKQLLLGIPFYAYQWHNVAQGGSYGLNSKGDPVRGNLNQSTAATLMQNPGAHLYRDPQSRAPWIYDGDNFLTFEDAISLQAKMDFARENNLGGTMVWELSGDTNDAQLLHALSESESTKKVSSAH
jgi:chitinase